MFDPIKTLLVLCLAPAPLWAQQNIAETPSVPTSACPGTALQIPLAHADFLELDGRTTHLAFGASLSGANISLCFDDSSVTLQGPAPISHSCSDIRDSPDEGIGHGFTAEDIPFHLWFYISPDSSSPTLEIGLYREDEQLLWIDTAAPICTG
jgi:hypothetical protein